MEKSVSTYSSRTVWIHWVSALMIFGLIFTGIRMEHQTVSEEKFLLYKIHFLLGSIVFLLTILRVFVLLKDAKPKPLYPKTSLREKFRTIVYYGFYIVLLWMCISGLASLSLEAILPALQSGNWMQLPEISNDGFHPIMLSHHIVAKLVFLLLLFHIAGFVIHTIQKRENTLKRIWFSANT